MAAERKVSLETGEIIAFLESVNPHQTVERLLEKLRLVDELGEEWQ